MLNLSTGACCYTAFTEKECKFFSSVAEKEGSNMDATDSEIDMHDGKK